MIALTPNGDFETNANGQLINTSQPANQNFISEVRCEQGTWNPDETFGRNPIIWTVSQSPKDRIDDLTRIGQKYIVVKNITYNPVTKVFNVQ